MILHKVLCLLPGTVGKPFLAVLAALLSSAKEENNKAAGYKHFPNVAQFCMLWFQQNYMSVYEALEEDRKVPVTQSGERR